MLSICMLAKKKPIFKQISQIEKNNTNHAAFLWKPSAIQVVIRLFFILRGLNTDKSRSADFHDFLQINSTPYT